MLKSPWMCVNRLPLSTLAVLTLLLALPATHAQTLQLAGHGSTGPGDYAAGAPGSVSLLANVVDLGTIEVTRIGHLFLDINEVTPEDPVMPKSVLNSLIDQDRSYWGEPLLRPVSVNWDTNIRFSLTVTAPPGHQFYVRVPAGNTVLFGGSLAWQSTRESVSSFGESVSSVSATPVAPMTATFHGLQGTAPRLEYGNASLSSSHQFFGFSFSSSSVSNDFAFGSITLTGNVFPQYTGNGVEEYVPQLGSDFMFVYTTFNGSDPGPYVSIVPIPSEATVDRLTEQIVFGPLSRTIKRPLLRSLDLCREALHHGDTPAALQLLRSFQRKVAAQIGPSDPARADQLITAAQDLLDTIE